MLIAFPACADTSDSNTSASLSEAVFTINTNCSPLMVSDSEFDLQLKRVLSSMSSRGSDLGEVIATSANIKPLNYENWYTEWTKTADHFRDVGNTAYKAGHMTSAHDAWMRAQTYYRAAEFFLHNNPEDLRILQSYNNSRETFQDAIKLDPVNIEIIRIPYENTTLPGYFYKVDDSGNQRPLLIIQTGFDGTQEELYANAIEGIRRGYNVLTFEGPGQGEMIRIQHLPFRYDWENVVTPVLNYATNRSEVDTNRISLWGISMGGYLAPRATAFDDRIAALIADAGVYDLADSFIEGFAQGFPDPKNTTRDDVFDFITSDKEMINKELYTMMENSTSYNWTMTQGMYVFDKKSPADVLLAYKNYTLENVIDQIKVPTLACDGESDTQISSRDQGKIFYDMLTCPKDYLLFTNEYCAGDHCQLGAPSISYQEKLDWLDEKIKP